MPVSMATVEIQAACFTLACSRKVTPGFTAPNPICPSDSGGRARHVTKLYKNYVVQILESELVLTYLCKAVSQCN